MQDYTCWCDLRRLESNVGQRYLTHESDDSRWEQHRTEHSLPEWLRLGHHGATKDDWCSFNRPQRAVTPVPSSGAASASGLPNQLLTAVSINDASRWRHPVRVLVTAYSVLCIVYEYTVLLQFSNNKKRTTVFTQLTLKLLWFESRNIMSFSCPYFYLKNSVV